VTLLAATPLLVPLATAFATVLCSHRPRMQQAMSLAGAWALLACASALAWRVLQHGTIRVAFGSWEPPFGIEFAADPLAAIMTLVAAAIGTATLIFQSSDADPAAPSPMLLPMVHALLAGVGGAFLTADLFNLYVWFEVILIASLGLLAHGTALRHLDATLRYFVLNAFGTLVLLMGIASVYAVSGHLNFAAIERTTLDADLVHWLPAIVAVSVALLVKAGAFPVFAWLPAAYHTLPAPLLALFAGLTTKVAVYALLRLLRDVFERAPALLSDGLGWLAALTMITGVLGAAYHWDIRRILAFHIVSQIGYMLMGIALATPEGDVATIFYVVHHIVVKANLFFIAGLVFRLTGSYDLRRIGGLYAARPALAVLFLVPALSLVGIPPLSGFWAKLLVVRESLTVDRPWWAAIALLVGLLTMYSMTKIWFEAFWKPHPREGWTPPRDTRLAPAYVATITLATITVVLGAWPEPFLRYATLAAHALHGSAAP
jgi:multicomponent Na+:H+ antiporter subunit D